MAFKLRDWLEEATAQVVPGDKRTASTVRQQRQKAPPAKTVSAPRNTLTNNALTRGVSRTIDQVNPLDSGRTWKQRTPFDKGSAVRQLTHNGATNVAGENIVKPLVRGGLALNQGMANAQRKIAGKSTLDTKQFLAQPGLGGIGKFADYKGTKRQITGDAITNVVNVAAPGSSALLRTAAAKVLPKATPKLLPTMISNAAVGAPTGAVGNVGTLIAGDEKITPKAITKSAKEGAIAGAAGGAALPAVGAIARPLAKKAVKGVKDVQRAQRERALEMASRPSGIKDVPINKLVGKDMSGYGDLSPARVDYYKKQIQRGQSPAAIVAMKGKDGKLYVEDGKHRLQAYKELGFNSVPSKLATPERLKLATQGGYIAIPGGKEPAKTATETATEEAVLETQQSVAPPVKPPTRALTAAAGDLDRPPTSTVAVPPTGKETRYASKTVPGSEFVSDPVKKGVKENAPLYDVETEKARYTSSLSRLKEQGDEAFSTDVTKRLETEKGKISSQDVADAQTLAQILDARGDTASLQKATDLYEKLSEHLTAAGQTVQAAAILSRRTPEGLRYWATKQLTQAGVKPTPQLQKQIQQLAAGTKTAANKDRAVFELTKLVNDNIPSSAGDKIINFWRAGLLTAPTTTGGNLLGNTGETLVRKGFVNPIATGVDALISLKTGKRTQTLAPLGSATRGAAEGTSKLKDFIKTGYDERNALSKYEGGEISYGNSPAGKAVGKYVNGVYRIMSVADQPYWYAARNEALGSIAKAEAMNRGLKGAQQQAFVDKFMKAPPTDAVERATAEAMYATFQNRTTLGNAASGLKRGTGKFKPIADFFIPFTQVPASIATRIVERTPVGTAANVIKQFIEVKKGGQFDQRALSQAIANGSFGPAVFGAGYALANSGLLTFGYPEDPKERKLWEAQGKQPYSVKVGNRWYSLNYLQPFGTLLAIGGQAKQAINEGASPGEVVAQGIATAGQSVMNQSFLKGISGALDVIDDPKQYAENWVENTTASTIPNFIRSAARAIDPMQRDPSGLKEGFQSGVPGWREDLPVKQDAFGRDLPAKDNAANQFLNPLKPSLARDEDPVVNEAQRLYTLDNGVLPSGIKKDSLGKDTELSTDQIRELQSALGTKVTDAWGQLIGAEEYNTLTDEQKAKALKSLSTDIAAVAKREYAAANQLGEYSPSFTGKQSKLTSRQSAILNGNLDVSTYARGDSANKTVLKGDGRGTALLDRVGTLNKDQREEWEAGNFDSDYEDVYKRSNQIRFEGLPDLPKNNKVLSLYADLLEKRSKGMTPLAENKAKLNFLKSAYKTDLPQASREILSASTSEIIDGLDSGFITNDQIAQAIQYDDVLVKTGLSSGPDIPNTVRRALGYGEIKGKGSGTGASKGSSDYGLSGLSTTLSTNKSLRQLAKRAMVSRK